MELFVWWVANSTGRLEFCAHGMWGRVCNALKYWGPDNARVVCQQLGFSEEGEIANFVLTNKHLLLLCTGAYVLEYEQRFGTSERSAVIGEVHCVGTEPELLECSHVSIGSHRCGINTDYSDIIISCYGR